MNDETLKLMIELQAVFEKYWGEWQEGDRGVVVYRGEQTRFLVYANYGEGLLAGTLCTITDKHGKINFDNDDPALVWLPPLYDDEQPERSLWGMVDWKRWQISQCWFDGTVDMSKDMKVDSRADTPTLALLKAIQAQEKEK